MGEQMRGVYPVVETPFHENLDIDYEGLRNVVEFNIECGAAGLLTTAMSREFYTLTDEEHNKVIETILDQNKDRVPVVVGIASRSQSHGVMFAKHAVAHGAHAISSTPPVVESVLGKVSWEKVREYYQAINSVVDIPIFIQNAPLLGGTLTAEQMMQLVQENDHVQYAKEEGNFSQQVTKKMLEIAKTLPEGTLSGVFAGGGAFTMLGDLDHGACGVMPASALTDIYVDIWNKYYAGDREGARALHDVAVIAQLYERQFWNPYGKALLVERGVIKCDAIRETTTTFDAQCYKEVSRIHEYLKPYFRV